MRTARANCPFSKLNPHELLDGLDLLTMTCAQGDAYKLSGPGHPEQTRNPYGAGVGNDRAGGRNGVKA